MSIYISNDLYLQDIDVNDLRRNRPLVGYKSVLGPSDISPSPENPDSPGSNAWSPDTYTNWQSLSDPDFPLDQEVDLINAGSDPIDYIAIAGHNFGTSGATYSIESASDGLNFDTVVVAPKIVGSDASIIEYFDESQHAKFRIVFVIPAAKFVKISHIKMGQITRLQRPRFGGVKPPLNNRVQGFSNTSVIGNYLGNKITAEGGPPWEITQQWNTQEFVRDTVKPFIDHMNNINTDTGNGPTGSFFYAHAPDDYPAEVQYCWKEPGQDVTPENQGSKWMQWQCSGDSLK